MSRYVRTGTIRSKVGINSPSRTLDCGQRRRRIVRDEERETQEKCEDGKNEESRRDRTCQDREAPAAPRRADREDQVSYFFAFEFRSDRLAVRQTIIFNRMVEYAETQLGLTYAAIADPTRRAILARLKRADARVTELAAPLAMSLNAVSKHIRVLERAGLVQREVQGRDHYLSL